MTIEQIKENLYSKKVDKILTSDFEYLYRNTCEFILEQYQIISKTITDTKDLQLMLPLASLDDFEIKEELNDDLKNLVLNTFKESSKITEIKLINYQKQEEELLATLSYFKHSKMDWGSIKEKQKMMTMEQSEKLMNYFSKKELTAFAGDFLNYTFLCNLDYLSIKKLTKNSLVNLLVQNISTANGYYTPPQIIDHGFQSEYIMTIKRSLKAYDEIQQSFPQFATYLIPIAFLQKILFTVNINQLNKLNLNIKNDLWLEIKKIHPTIHKMYCA